jgi:hypothetical protein
MNGGDGARLYTFYETPVFTAKLAQVTGENALPTLYAIQADLIVDPLRWPVVKGTGGARKGRIADPGSGKGKSGSFICTWNIAVRFTCYTCSLNLGRPI